MQTAEAQAYCFYDDTLPEWNITWIVLAEDGAGDVWFPVRPIIEALGVDRPTQQGIIQQDSRTKKGVRQIKAPTRGGKQTVLYIRQRECAIWLTLIDPDNVGELAKGRLEDFQGALWHIAERIIFKRARGVAAAAHGPTASAKLSGVQSAIVPCPCCGELLIAELEDGELRLTHK